MHDTKLKDAILQITTPMILVISLNTQDQSILLLKLQHPAGFAHNHSPAKNILAGSWRWAEYTELGIQSAAAFPPAADRTGEQPHTPISKYRDPWNNKPAGFYSWQLAAFSALWQFMHAAFCLSYEKADIAWHLHANVSPFMISSFIFN